jgi:hypothetical protein
LEPPADQLLLEDLLNAYDDEKTALLETGRIKKRSYEELMAVAHIVADTLRKTRPVESIKLADLKAFAREFSRPSLGF